MLVCENELLATMAARSSWQLGEKVTTFEFLSLVLQFSVAAGTIGAVIVALYLANRPIRPKIETTVSGFFHFDSDLASPDGIVIHAVNTGSAPIRIENILLQCSNGFLYFTTEFNPRSYAVDYEGEVNMLAILNPLEKFEFEIDKEDYIRSLELSYAHPSKRGLRGFLPKKFRKWYDINFGIAPVAQISVTGERDIHVDLKEFLRKPFAEFLKKADSVPRKETLMLYRKMLAGNVDKP